MAVALVEAVISLGFNAPGASPRHVVFAASQDIYDAAITLGDKYGALLNNDPAAWSAIEDLEDALRMLGRVQKPSIPVLLLGQFFAYRSALSDKAAGRVEQVDAGRFRGALCRLLDELVPTDRRQDFSRDSFESFTYEVEDCEDALTSEQPQHDAAIEGPSLDKNWSWNPFASNAELVELLEDLAAQLAAKADELASVLDLLTNTFEIGPPRSRDIVSLEAGQLLVHLYLDRAHEDTPLSRTVGYTLASWIYNNPMARQLLLNIDFIGSLVDVPLNFAVFPTMGLILRNLVYDNPRAQERFVDSDLFEHMRDLLAAIVTAPLASVHVVLATSRICSILLEVRVFEHAGGVTIAKSIWPLLCRLITRARKYPLLLYKCALVMKVFMTASASEFVLTAGARSACEMTLASIKCKGVLRWTLTSLIPSNVYVYQSLDEFDVQFDPDDL